MSKPEMSPAELQEVAGRIKALRKKSTEYAIEIGHELLRVKASLPHGVFANWVESECEFKIRMAQNFMKLAREAASNPELTAALVPSTLRVILSNSTPPAIRQLVKTRLSNGERVSRKDLHSAIAAAKAGGAKHSNPAVPFPGLGGGAKLDLLAVGNTGADTEIDRARKVAEVLLQRLSERDLEYIMDGMNWGIWNRVLVWLRAEPKVAPAKPARPSNAIGSAEVPAA